MGRSYATPINGVFGTGSHILMAAPSASSGLKNRIGILYFQNQGSGATTVALKDDGGNTIFGPINLSNTATNPTELDLQHFPVVFPAGSAVNIVNTTTNNILAFGAGETY